MHSTKGKKPIWKVQLHDILEKAELEDSKKTSGCQALGDGERLIGRTQRTFRAVRTLTYTVGRGPNGKPGKTCQQPLGAKTALGWQQQGNRYLCLTTTRNWIWAMTWMILEADSSVKPPQFQPFKTLNIGLSWIHLNFWPTETVI